MYKQAECPQHHSVYTDMPGAYNDRKYIQLGTIKTALQLFSEGNTEKNITLNQVPWFFNFHYQVEKSWKNRDDIQTASKCCVPISWFLTERTGTLLGCTQKKKKKMYTLPKFSIVGSPELIFLAWNWGLGNKFCVSGAEI